MRASGVSVDIKEINLICVYIVHYVYFTAGLIISIFIKKKPRNFKLANLLTNYICNLFQSLLYYYKSLGVVIYCLSRIVSKTNGSIVLNGWPLTFNFSRMVLEKKKAKIEKGPVLDPL